MAGFFHRFYGWLLRMFWYVFSLVPPSGWTMRPLLGRSAAARHDCPAASFFGLTWGGEQGLGNGHHHARAAECRQNVDTESSGGEYPGRPMLSVRVSSDRANQGGEFTIE
jgi:hypothetical protein